VFTFTRNGCSRSSGLGVHVAPEWLFTMGRNTHVDHHHSCRLLELSESVSWSAPIKAGGPL